MPERASCCRGRVRTAPRHAAATGCASVRLPLSRASPNGSATCGGDWSRSARLPLSRAILKGFATCGGDWQLRASRRLGRVRRALWHVAATGTTGVRLPSSRASPNGSARHVATTGRNTCKSFWAKAQLRSCLVSNKIFLLKGVAEVHLAASSHGPFIAPLHRHKAQGKALPSFCLADDDYVLISFTSLRTSSKSFRVSRVVVFAFRLCFCHFATFRPNAGADRCCCSFFQNFCKIYIKLF